jgi:hypothetical protein
MSSLAIAVPILAQVSSAASTSSIATTNTRPIPSQACVTALAAQEGTMISKIDSMMATHKTILQAHQAALTAAAGIADDTARQAAITKANEDMRTAMKAAMSAKDEMTAAKDALKAACGDTMPFHGGMGFEMGMGGPGFGGKHGRMHGSGDLAAKLGLTEDQLKTELDSGKTIQQIATEHGVTLPSKGEHKFFGRDNDTEINDDAVAPVQQ